jgi:hypothetical protein
MEKIEKDKTSEKTNSDKTIINISKQSQSTTSAVVFDIPPAPEIIIDDNATKTLKYWYYTLLIKTFSYKFAATEYLHYANMIKMPIAFLTTICTVLQGTQLLTSSELLFYIYFAVQLFCTFLTVFNIKMNYSEDGAQYKSMAKKYESQTYKIQSMINLKELKPESVKKTINKLENMISQDEATDLSYEERAKIELNTKNRRLLKMVGITPDTETSNTRRPSSSVKKT